MDTSSELPSGFAASSLHQVDPETPVQHFTPDASRTDGRDRHGNRLFTSRDKGYEGKTGETKSALLVSEQGEALLQTHPGFLHTLDKGLAYMESLPDPSVVREPFNIGDGWTIKYVGKGGQSHVALIEHTNGTKLIVKIKNSQDPKSANLNQPYINEMLQGQALAEDMQEELQAAGVRLPTYYMASGQMILMEYAEGTEHPTSLQVDHARLFSQVNEYITSHRDDPLWTGITADAWDTPAEPWQRNFIQQPDGSVLWVDPFVYEPSLVKSSNLELLAKDFNEALRVPFEKLVPAPYLLPSQRRDDIFTIPTEGLLEQFKLLRNAIKGMSDSQEEQVEENQESQFDVVHERYVQKHSAELPSQPETPPAIGVVVRAYMELSNGNLTQLLDSASRVSAEAGTFEMTIVVNNPRMYAYAARAMDALGIPRDAVLTLDQQKQIADFIERQYVQEGIEQSGFEKKYLKNLREKEYPPLTRHVAAFYENQATLAALRVVTQSVEQMRNGANSEETIARAREQISTILQTQTNLSDAQREAFVETTGSIIQEGIMVIGLDCSSEANGFSKVNLGQASDEGCHVAVERGAKVLYPIDADFLLSAEGFTEIIEHSSQTNPTEEVFYLPLQVKGFQHPEQMQDSQSVYLSMLEFYKDIFFYRRKQYGDYLSGSRSTGKIMFTAEAFRKIGGYAHGDWTEDFDTARSLERPDIHQHYLTHTYQILSHRGREESYDGRGLGASVTKPQEDYLREAQKERENGIKSLQNLDEKMRAILQEDPNDPLFSEFRQLYEDLSDAYFQEEQQSREWMRRIFLGVDANGQNIQGEGAFLEVLNAYQQFRNANPDVQIDSSIVHHIIEHTLAQYADNPQKQRLIAVFFERNPLIVYALVRQIDEIRAATGKDVTPEELIARLESDAPELFAKPSQSRPTSETSIEQKPISDWSHVFMAAQNLAAAALNYMQEHPDLPAEQRERLERIVDLAKGGKLSLSDSFKGGAPIQSFAKLMLPQLRGQKSQRYEDLGSSSAMSRIISNFLQESREGDIPNNRAA